MKHNNQEKSPYSTISMDPVMMSGEKPKKEEFNGRHVSSGDLRIRKGEKNDRA